MSHVVSHSKHRESGDRRKHVKAKLPYRTVVSSHPLKPKVPQQVLV